MIYKPTKNKKHSTYCKCICDCGNIVERNISGLKRGNGETIHSCGCAREEIADRKSRDIVGEVFGRLLVMDEIKTSSGRKVKCICECGNEMIASKCDVTSGHTQSCGCLQSERASESNQKDWIGYVSDYGVKLLAQSHQDSMGKWIWTCECFCGNTFCSLPIKIVSGHTTSCGCRRQSSREFFIEEVLKENNIDFQTQYTFQDCKNKYVLRFDFALLRDNKVFYLIEYDGMQHYTPIKHFGGIDGFEKTISRDKIKNDYCKNKSIPLLRLKYDLSDQEIKEKIVNILKP